MAWISFIIGAVLVAAVWFFYNLGWIVFVTGAMLACTVWLVQRVCRGWSSAPRAAKAVAVLTVLATLFATFWTVGMEMAVVALRSGSIDPSRQAVLLAEEISNQRCWTLWAFVAWFPSMIVGASLTRRPPSPLV